MDLTRAPRRPSADDRTGTSRSEVGEALVRYEPTRAELDPVGHLRRRRILERALAVGVPASLLLLWQVASEAAWIDERFFPPPTEIWGAARVLIDNGDLQEAVWLSTKRILLGFALGVLTGVAVGLATGMSRLLKAALEPLLSALYTVPKLALLPLLLLIFGIGETPKIMLIAITVFFFMWISTMSAIIAVAAPYREAATSLGANPVQMFRHVLFPAALPQIFVGLRLSAGVAVLVVVGVEFVQGGSGIGNLIWFSWSLFLADRMYVGIVAVALMGVIFTTIIQAVAKLVMPWSTESGGGGIGTMR